MQQGQMMGTPKRTPEIENSERHTIYYI